MSPIKTCFYCKFINVWSDQGSYYQPPDSGWECNHESVDEFDFGEESPSDTDNQQEIAFFYGSKCKKWQYDSKKAECVQEIFG